MQKTGRLCITRSAQGKRIKITTPDNHVIWVGIAKTRFNRAVVAIEATREVKILREELLER